jgi:hypothetical protein
METLRFMLSEPAGRKIISADHTQDRLLVIFADGKQVEYFADVLYGQGAFTVEIQPPLR